MDAIVYTSNTGFTEKYAKLLGGKLFLPVYSLEEAKGKLETIYTEKLETEIPVQYNEYETTINANLFETKYNIEDAVKKAIEKMRFQPLPTEKHLSRILFG